MRDFSKPIVVSTASINCSAAYEISSQADYLYCARSSEVGSIGTVMQSVDYSGLMRLLGIEITNISSAESKDSSYGSRPLTDEERAYYQQMVDEINAVFVENVAQGRHMDVNAVNELATGLPFTGTQGVANGLFDEIGTLEMAQAKAAELAGAGSDYQTMSLDLREDELSELLDLMSSSKDRSSISAEDLAEAVKELKQHDGIAQ